MTDPNQVPHHWAQGPMDVHKVQRFYRDGRTFDWKFYWYLDRVVGTTRRKALQRITDVLRNGPSWERTGARFVRTIAKQGANIWVSVIPEATTYCGQGAAGCYCASCDQANPGRATAEIGVEYIDRPGFWDELVNMELVGHGVFRMADMYVGDATGGHASDVYVGVQGTWFGAEKSGYYPSDAEIEDAKLWLQGKAPEVHP